MADFKFVDISMPTAPNGTQPMKLTLEMALIVIFLAPLAVSLQITQVADYPISIAFVLAPIVVALCLARIASAFSLFLVAAAAAGVISCFWVERTFPDGQTARHLLALLLCLFSASFIVPGAWVGTRGHLPSVIRWLAIFSAAFVIPIALRNIVGGIPVRGYDATGNYLVLDAVWLGLPVFATFGILSIAALFCIQSFILAAAIFDRTAPIPLRLIFGAGLVASSFLVTASDARGSQIALLCLPAVLGFLAFRSTERIIAWATIGLLLIGVAVTIGIGNGPSRLFNSLNETAQIAEQSSAVPTAAPEALAGAQAPGPTLNDISTGRLRLISEAVADIRHHPIFGTGFSGYGRFGGPTDANGNTSTHVYFLTLAWRGGLLFLLPMLLLIGFALLKAIRSSRLDRGYPRLVLLAGVLAVFGPLSMTWDVPIVPAVGALSFFLLGALSVPTIPNGEARRVDPAKSR